MTDTPKAPVDPVTPPPSPPPPLVRQILDLDAANRSAIFAALLNGYNETTGQQLMQYRPSPNFCPSFPPGAVR